MALTPIKPGAARTVSGTTAPAIARPSEQLTTAPPPADVFVPGAKPTVKELVQLTKLEGARAFKALDPSVRQQLLRSLSASQPVTSSKVETAKALLSSEGFKALSPDNQKVAVDALARGGFNGRVGESLASLVRAPSFQAAQQVDQTSMLSQARNYPNTQSIGNIERLSGKLWFAAQSHEDKQRSLKTIAYMSQPDRGDRNIMNNTLEKLLGPDSKYDIEWTEFHGHKAGHAVDEDTLQLERAYAPADNGPGRPAAMDFVGNNIVPHEVNHLLSDYKVESSFKFVEDEYRGWYVGHQAQHNRPPSRAEAAAYFKKAYIDGITGIYGGTASGVRRGPEAHKFYDLISKATGTRIDANNFADALPAYAEKNAAIRSQPAPPPPGNIDNR